MGRQISSHKHANREVTKETPNCTASLCSSWQYSWWHQFHQAYCSVIPKQVLLKSGYGLIWNSQIPYNPTGDIMFLFIHTRKQSSKYVANTISKKILHLLSANFEALMPFGIEMNVPAFGVKSWKFKVAMEQNMLEKALVNNSLTWYLEKYCADFQQNYSNDALRDCDDLTNFRGQKVRIKTGIKYVRNSTFEAGGIQYSKSRIELVSSNVREHWNNILPKPAMTQREISVIHMGPLPYMLLLLTQNRNIKKKRT